MNWLIIEQLLERFWEGETSLEEEQELKRAFLREDLPIHLVPLKNYFVFATDQENIKLPNKDFETTLLQKLEATKKPILTLPRLLPYAAGFLLLMSSLFFLLESEESEQYKPLTAKELQVAQKYMSLLARNMGKSVSFSNQHLQKLELLNSGTQMLQQYGNTYNKQIKNLNKIEHINHSFTQLKYLKTFETSMKIIAL